MSRMPIFSGAEITMLSFSQVDELREWMPYKVSSCASHSLSTDHGIIVKLGFLTTYNKNTLPTLTCQALKDKL